MALAREVGVDHQLEVCVSVVSSIARYKKRAVSTGIKFGDLKV